MPSTAGEPPRGRRGAADDTLRSASAIAPSTSWVTSSMVALCRRLRPRTRSCMRSRVIASSEPNGSSSRTSAGSATSRCPSSATVSRPVLPTACPDVDLRMRPPWVLRNRSSRFRSTHQSAEGCRAPIARSSGDRPERSPATCADLDRGISACMFFESRPDQPTHLAAEDVASAAGRRCRTVSGTFPLGGISGS
jgi:hypothetical protein